MKKAIIDIVTFDVADIIQTSSGGKIITDDLGVIWLSASSVNYFNSKNENYQLQSTYEKRISMKETIDVPIVFASYGGTGSGWNFGDEYYWELTEKSDSLPTGKALNIIGNDQEYELVLDWLLNNGSINN